MTICRVWDIFLLKSTALVHNLVLHAVAVAETLPSPTSALGALRASRQLCDFHKLLNLSEPRFLICLKHVILITLQDCSEDCGKITLHMAPLPGCSAWQTPSLCTHKHGPNLGCSEAQAQVILLALGSLDMLAPKRMGSMPHSLGNSSSSKSLLMLTFCVFRICIPHLFAFPLIPAPPPYTCLLLCFLLITIGFHWHLPKDPHTQTPGSTFVISQPTWAPCTF